MNILIVKLSAIGDVVMTLPFLAALRRRYPDANVTWLVEEASAGVLDDHPQIDRVLVSRRKAWMRDLKKGRWGRARREAARFLRELRDREYDLVIDLQGLFKSGILAYLSGGKRRVGFDRTRELSYLFVNERLARYDPDRHALERYLDAAVYLGADPEWEVVWELPAGEALLRRARELTEPLPGRLVVINPGAKWDSKLWPTSSWRELGRLLSERADVSLILTGSPDEAQVNREIGQGLDDVLDLTGKTGLSLLAEIFRLAELVVCPDTGPMHLAAAVGSPVVALFGPTAPWRTGPYGPGHTVLRTGAPCAPCFRKKCPDPHCMTGLSPETVFEAVVARLANGESRPESTNGGRNGSEP